MIIKRHLVHVLSEGRNAIVIPCAWDAARSFMLRCISAYLLDHGADAGHAVEVWENLSGDEAGGRGSLAGCAGRDFSDMSIMLMHAPSDMPSQIEPAPVRAAA